jgi:hypothetical protein
VEIEILAGATMLSESIISKTRVVMVVVKVVDAPTMFDPTPVEEAVDQLDADVEDVKGFDGDPSGHGPIDTMGVIERTEIRE